MSAMDFSLFTPLAAGSLQAIGWAYLVGAICAAHRASVVAAPAPGAPRARRSGALAWPLAAPLPGADDAARRGWRLATALLVMFAGAAMVSRDEAAPAALAALLVQQSLYLVRQRLAELERARPSEAAAQRPSVLTVWLFVLTGACALGAAMLQALGALR